VESLYPTIFSRNRKGTPFPEVPLCCKNALILADVFGDGAPVAFFQVKRHTLTFCQRPETGHVDGAVVDKHVTTPILLNETIPLVVAEPLNRSFCQTSFLLSIL
jgi:hypothetical protein